MFHKNTVVFIFCCLGLQKKRMQKASLIFALGCWHWPMDLALWKKIPKNILLIPVDTHVLRISRHLGLTKRKDNSWRTAQEITDGLKKLDPLDPLDLILPFAIWGYRKNAQAALN